MVLKHSSKFKDVELSYVTMPGEALKTSFGKWYYVLNKNACEGLLADKIRSFNGNFDADGRFVDNTNQAFMDIYNRRDIEYKEYSASELPSI